MVAEYAGNATPSLFPEAVEAKKKESNFFIYYAKPKRGRDDDGWIVAKPGWANERSKWTEKGWVPLDQFGRFIPGQDSRDVRDIKFDAFRETYRVFFQKGGAEHVPVSQVIAFGWHRTPPYKEITFPQLEGVEWQDFNCPSCTRSPFNQAIDLSTHLMIGHRWSWADLREYGKEMGYDFSNKSHLQPIEAPEAVAEIPNLTPMNVGAIAGEEPSYNCDACAWTQKPDINPKRRPQALKAHQRTKHKELEAVASAPEGVTSDGVPQLP